MRRKTNTVMFKQTCQPPRLKKPRRFSRAENGPSQKKLMVNRVQGSALVGEFEGDKVPLTQKIFQKTRLRNSNFSYDQCKIMNKKIFTIRT